MFLLVLKLNDARTSQWERGMEERSDTSHSIVWSLIAQFIKNRKAISQSGVKVLSADWLIVLSAYKVTEYRTMTLRYFTLKDLKTVVFFFQKTLKYFRCDYFYLLPSFFLMRKKKLQIQKQQQHVKQKSSLEQNDCLLVWFHRSINKTDQRHFLHISLGRNYLPVAPGTVPGTAEEVACGLSQEVNVLPVETFTDREINKTKRKKSSLILLRCFCRIECRKEKHLFKQAMWTESANQERESLWLLCSIW